MDPKNPRELLYEGGAQLGINFTTLQLDQLVTYLSELIRWNKKINLTGLQNTQEMVINLFLDSLTPLLFLSPSKDVHWIDIGTGAGFPGLVLKIVCPELNITLLEPTQKKVSFLHYMIGLFGLTGVSVHNKRIEEISQTDIQRKYDLLLTRALSPKVVLGKGGRLVQEGGQLLFFKGRSEVGWWQDLIEKYPFLELEKISPVRLPFSSAERSLVFLRVLKTSK